MSASLTLLSYLPRDNAPALLRKLAKPEGRIGIVLNHSSSRDQLSKVMSAQCLCLRCAACRPGGLKEVCVIITW